MNAITDLFTGIQSFCDVVPGVEASKTLAEMEPAYEIACTKIQDIISAEIFDLIVDEVDADPPVEPEIPPAEPEDPTPEEVYQIMQKALLYLQGATGNFTRYQHLIFDVISKKKEDQNLYRYELQAMNEAYLDNFWNYMDRLLTLLDANTAIFTTWENTDTFIDRATLVLKSSKEFAKWYGTAGSEYFVMRTIYKQHEIIDDHILPRMKIEDITGNLEAPVKRFIAYSVVAAAIQEFDYADLPRSIRNDISAEQSRKQGYQEELIKERIWKTYEAKAAKYLNQVDLILTKPAAGVSEVIINDGLNLETDKTFLMS
jgi:hypothetical protein